MCVVPVVYRVVLVRRRLGTALAVAQGIVDARNTAKVERQVAGSADDAPVLIGGDQNLTGRHGASCNLKNGICCV